MKKKPTHGGLREGAGRPAGTGSGRKVVTFSVTMSQAAKDALTAAATEADLSRGAYIAKKLRL
jgi:hypothetical protein